MKSISFLKKITALHKAKDSCPEEDNDLSYEDALLDWKLRRFMQAEYGHAEPPKGVFARVLAAIKRGNTEEEITFGTMLKRLAVGCYNVLAKPTATSRILPGIVTFALVVMVLSTNTGHILSNTQNNYPLNPTINETPNITLPQQLISIEQEQQEQREQVIRRGTLPEGLNQFYPSATLAFYHPIERHMSIPKKHTTESSEQFITDDSQYLTTTKNDGF